MKGDGWSSEDYDGWQDAPSPEDDADEYDESLDACPGCDTLPSKCYGGCCEDCNHANSWHAGMVTGDRVNGSPVPRTVDISTLDG